MVGHDKIDGGADSKYRYNVKVQMAVIEMPCCIHNGDVRGMCFTRIGDLDTMTLKQLVQVSKCPNLCNAMAYWLFNNHQVSTIRRPGFISLYRFLPSNPELAVYLDILLKFAGITRTELNDTIYEEHDAD